MLSALLKPPHVVHVERYGGNMFSAIFDIFCSVLALFSVITLLELPLVFWGMKQIEKSNS